MNVISRLGLLHDIASKKNLGLHDIAPKEIILLLLIVTPLASCSEVFTLDYMMVFEMIVIFKTEIMIISKVANHDHFSGGFCQPSRSQPSAHR